MIPYMQVKDLPVELQETAMQRVLRGLPKPVPFTPLCGHASEHHVTEADGTVWCRVCTKEAQSAG